MWHFIATNQSSDVSCGGTEAAITHSQGKGIGCGSAQRINGIVIRWVGVGASSAINTEGAVGTDFGNGRTADYTVTNTVTKGRTYIHIVGYQGTSAIAKGIGCHSIGIGSNKVGGGNRGGIIRAGRGDRDVLGDRTTFTVIDGDGKDFTGGLIKC